MRKVIPLNEAGRRIGEGHPRAKLTGAHVAVILALRQLGLTYAAIAEKLDDIPGGVSWLTVRDVCTQRNWNHTVARYKVQPTAATVKEEDADTRI